MIPPHRQSKHAFRVRKRWRSQVGGLAEEAQIKESTEEPTDEPADHDVQVGSGRVSCSRIFGKTGNETSGDTMIWPFHFGFGRNIAHKVRQAECLTGFCDPWRFFLGVRLNGSRHDSLPRPLVPHSHCIVSRRQRHTALVHVVHMFFLYARCGCQAHLNARFKCRFHDAFKS